MKTLDYGNVPSLGVVYGLPITIANQVLSGNFHIIDGIAFDLILGFDFILRYQSSVGMIRRNQPRVRIPMEFGDCFEPVCDSTWELDAETDCELSSKSESFVTCVFSHSEADPTVSLDSVKATVVVETNLTEDLIVGRQVLETNKRKVAVKVLNPTEDPLTINVGQRLSDMNVLPGITWEADELDTEPFEDKQTRYTSEVNYLNIDDTIDSYEQQINPPVNSKDWMFFPTDQAWPTKPKLSEYLGKEFPEWHAKFKNLLHQNADLWM